MNTQWWIVDESDNDKLHNHPGLAAAAQQLRDNEVVAFPTETVYGLGANALSPEAVDKIFRAKGRPSDNPLIVHIAELSQLDGLVTEVPEQARKCMAAFWPGPITFILPAAEIIPANVTAGLSTVGIRMPGHPVARTLIALAGVPLAAPSANRSGRPSPTLAEHVKEDLDGLIAGIVDGGPAGFGVESTVVDMTSDIPVILRPGGITAEQLADIVGEVRWDPALFNNAETPRSPGMKYTHYAPKGDLVLIEGMLSERFFHEVNRLAERARANGEKVGILTTAENVDKYSADIVLGCGTRCDLNSVASKLYDCLRQFDEQGATLIFAEAFPEHDIGTAIMNRLRKAAGGNVIRIT